MDSMILEAAYRIGRMELCFDILQRCASEDPSSIQDKVLINELLQELREYYEGGQWLRDYELDEQGPLPQSLKRGILSQDAVFDFLGQI